MNAVAVFRSTCYGLSSKAYFENSLPVNSYATEATVRYSGRAYLLRYSLELSNLPLENIGSGWAFACLVHGQSFVGAKLPGKSNRSITAPMRL